MILTERRTDQGLLVTVCDSDLLGETFESGDVSLTVDESFYDGEGSEEAGEEAVVQSLGKASVANIVGTESVELAIREGFVDRANVLEVDGTLHAQLLRMG